MSLTKYSPRGGLVHSSGLDSNKSILHDINAANTIRTFYGNDKKGSNKNNADN